MSVSLNAKIPFQPGLALGSIVRGDIIDKMEKYGESLAQIEKVQKEMRDLEQAVSTLRTKIEAISQKKLKGPLDEELERLFTLQQDSLIKKMKKLPDRLVEINSLELPSFSNISTGLESPINFDIAEVATDNRGFDSITYSSQYIDMKESNEKIQDKLDQSSSASQVSVEASGWFVSGGASHSWSSGATKRVGEIKNQGHASSVLLINALVTTRHVNFFKKRAYDIDKLSIILKQMKTITDVIELNQRGITINSSKEKCIYLLTEAVMGGSFSAIVTYLKEDHTNRNMLSRANHSSSSTSARAGGSLFGFGAQASVANSRQQANESHDDEIHNRGNVNMTIELIAQGAIPQLARETVVRETLKYQDQNLRKYHSSGNFEPGKSVHARQGELQKAMYDTANTIHQTKVEKEELSIHSPNAVLKAYDDFCGEMVSDSSCGVPIGFNYTVLTESYIENYIKQFETPEIKNPELVEGK